MVEDEVVVGFGEDVRFFENGKDEKMKKIIDLEDEKELFLVA